MRTRNNTLRKKTTVFPFLLIAILLTGCGTLRMPISPKTTVIDVSEKSIVVMTLRTENHYRPSYQPFVTHIMVEPQAADTKHMRFGAERPYDKQRKAYCEYVVSFDLLPGNYTVRDICGRSSGLLIHGSFAFPLAATFEVPAQAIIYVGHVKMVNRQRKKHERRSGSVIPLIDQAATGFSGGTFDITVSDRYAKDVQTIQQYCPALSGRKILRAKLKRGQIK